MELIKISEHNGKQAVSARDLHAFLESKRDFSNWIKDRIEKYGFIENQDFILLNNFGEQTGRGGHNKIEYALTLNTAKELAMLEANNKGKQARQYFIECEKKLRENTKALTPAEQLLHNAQLLVEQERRLADHDNRLNEIEAKITTAPNYFSVMGYCVLKKLNCPRTLAIQLSKKAAKICKERNILTDSTPDPRFGSVKLYPYSILEEVVPAFL